MLWLMVTVNKEPGTGEMLKPTGGSKLHALLVSLHSAKNTHHVKLFLSLAQPLKLNCQRRKFDPQP